MTPEEMSALTIAETELAASRQQERDCIEKAREWNAATRVARSRSSDLERVVQPLRDKLAAHNAEQKRIAAEKLKADAEARAKALEESELMKLKMENAKLKEALEAKE